LSGSERDFKHIDEKVSSQAMRFAVAARANDRNRDRGRVIWVYGGGEDGILAFTDFGIEERDRAYQVLRKTLDC
jgi:hypothetical protein